MNLIRTATRRSATRLDAWAALAASAAALMACGAHAAGASTSAARAATAAAGASTTAAATSAPTATTAAFRSGDWPTFDFTAARTGVGPADTGITAANAGRLSLRRVKLDGTVDSSAIELHALRVHGRARDVIFVTTTYGKTIAIDAATGGKLWEFVPRSIGRYQGSAQITTSSPVADPNRGFIYAASADGVIHKLAAASGRQVWARRVTFDPRHEKLASALNLSGRWVIVVTGGYNGDIPPYDGHVVTIDRTSGRIGHVWNTECANRHLLIAASSCAVTQTNGDSAIWARAGAVVEPGSARILVATGNGPFDGSLNWGDSVLELSADASRLLHNWTPKNQAALSSSDADVGSTAPALLPRYHGFTLAVQGGKDSRLHLLNLGGLDGTGGAAGPRLGGELSEVGAPGGSVVVSAPADLRDHGRILLFVATDGGTTAYQLVGGRHPRLGVAWAKGTPGTSPVIAGGLLYVYDESDGALTIRLPGSGKLVRSLRIGTGHWNSPIVVGGRAIEPEGDANSHSSAGVLDIFHLPGR
jgi:hypothetical protein